MNSFTAFNVRFTEEHVEILNEFSLTYEKKILDWDEIYTIAFVLFRRRSSVAIVLDKDKMQKGAVQIRHIKHTLFFTKKKERAYVAFFENLIKYFPEKDAVKRINLEREKKVASNLRKSAIVRASLFILAFFIPLGIEAISHLH